MKNLDQSISNKSVLDESFNNADGTSSSYDLSTINLKISVYKDRLKAAQLALANWTPSFKSKTPFNEKNAVDSAQNSLSFWQSELAKFPKVLVDLNNQQQVLQTQLDNAEKDKLAAAQLLVLQNKNNAIQEAIDKAKGVANILENKTQSASKPSENKSTDEKTKDANVIPPLASNSTTIFTTKNIIIGVSILGAFVGGFFLLKKFKK